MADYAVTGKKGSGKSLFCVGVIRDSLASGKRVASNLDVHLDHLLSPSNKFSYIRLPDRPTVADFEALGRGQSGVVEDDNGIIVLDETSTFFNSRQFGDKTRQPMLDWLVHSRKLGWDVWYICQGLAQIDKQLRETMIEYHVTIKRTDKWPIPFFTPLAKLIGFNLRFPKYHIGIIRHGIERDALLIERRWYRGKEFFPAYDTQQIFLDRDHPLACGIHSKLSAFHLKGRYLNWWNMNKHLIFAGLTMGLIIGGIVGSFGGYRYSNSSKPPVASFNVDKSVHVVGVVRGTGFNLLSLSDGRFVESSEMKTENNVDFFRVADKWISTK
jgi:hypothetical protein